MSFFRSLGSFLSPVGGALAGGGMGMSYREPNPADAAMPHLNRIPGIGQQYLAPYIQRGEQGERGAQDTYNQIYNEYDTMPNDYLGMTNVFAHMPDLYGRHNINFEEMPAEYGRMARDPNAFMNDIMKNYEPSTGYKFRESRALRGAQNAANLGGYAGNRFDQEKQAEMINGLMGQDQQQFLENIMGLQGQGLGAEERRIGRSQQGRQNMLLGQERHQQRQYEGTERNQARQYEGAERFRARQYEGRHRALEGRAHAQENQANRGFMASQALSDLLSNLAGSQAGFGFQGARQNIHGRQQASSNRMQMLSGLLGGVGSAIGGMR